MNITNLKFKEITHFRYSLFFLTLLIGYMPIMGIYIPKTNFGPGIPDFGPVRLTEYILILVFILELTLKKNKLRVNKWIFILFVFLLYVFLSVYWSQWYSYDRSTIQSIFSSVAAPVLIALISINVLSTDKNIKLFIKHLVISGLILSLIAFIQFRFNLSTVHGELRAAATLQNPNKLAIFLVLIVPSLLYAIDSRIFKPYIGWLIFFVFAAGIASTVSRKGIATLILSFGIYALLKRDLKKIVALFVLVSLLAVAVFQIQALNQRFEKHKRTHDLHGKIAMAKAGLDMFSKHPVLGLGYRGYYENYGKYFHNTYRKKYDAHNEFITALANYGIIGFMIFMSIFLFPLALAARILIKVRDGTRRDMATICIASIIPYMINILFAGTAFYQPTLTCLFYAVTSFVFLENGDRGHIGPDGYKKVGKAANIPGSV